jgi:hypothetical protein
MELKLISLVELPLEVMKDWYSCVKMYAPEGCISTVQKKTPTGYKDVCLAVKRIGDKFEYVIALTRNLSEEEVEEIIENFDYNGDYSIESSSDPIQSLTMDEDNYEHICTQMAKHRHEKWVRERIEDGWRYGPAMSLKNKTSPLLKPWHELSDEHKTVDRDEPEQIIKMLADNGYYVISKHELEGIKALLRL